MESMGTKWYARGRAQDWCGHKMRKMGTKLYARGRAQDGYGHKMVCNTRLKRVSK